MPVTDRSRVQPTAAICRWSRDIRGMDLEAFPQVNPRKTEGSRRKRDPCMIDRSDGQCFIDPPVSSLLAAVNALRVHPQQHLHTVTCTVSHLRGRDPEFSRIRSRRQRCAPPHGVARAGLWPWGPPGAGTPSGLTNCTDPAGISTVTSRGCSRLPRGRLSQSRSSRQGRLQRRNAT
jgi:hypothetical protein